MTRLYTIRTTALCAMIGAMISGQSCAPVFYDFQDASVQKPGTVQVTPSVSSVSFTDEEESGHSQNQIGIQVGVGVADRADFRTGLTRVLVANGGGGVNVMSFGPKFNLIRNRVAFYTPVGFAFGQDIDVSQTWQFHPTLLVTKPLSERIDLTPSIKALVPLYEDGETTVAINLGMGIGPGGNQWKVRPEVGMLFNPGESGVFWSVGLGLSFSTGK